MKFGASISRNYPRVSGSRQSEQAIKSQTPSPCHQPSSAFDKVTSENDTVQTQQSAQELKKGYAGIYKIKNFPVKRPTEESSHKLKPIVRPSNASVDRKLRPKPSQYSTFEAERIIQARKDNMHCFNKFYEVSPAINKRSKDTADNIRPERNPIPALIGAKLYEKVKRRPEVGKGVKSQKFQDQGLVYDHHLNTSANGGRLKNAKAAELLPEIQSGQRKLPSDDSITEGEGINFNSFDGRSPAMPVPKIVTEKKKEEFIFMTDNPKKLGQINNVHFEEREVVKILGQGSFSTIYLARCQKTGELQAVKLFKSRSEDAEHEFRIIKGLEHQNIIQAYQVVVDNLLRKPYIVMEYAKGRTLKEIQMLNNPQIFSEEVTIRLFGQILSGVAYMHSNGIAHCDLKMENVIYSSETNLIKIIDLGFARHNDERVDNLYCGSMGYMSPQILKRVKHCLFKSDVWALGIILFKMLFNFFPFKGKNEMEILMRIERNSVSYPSNIRVSQRMMKFLNLLMSPKEAARPTAEEAFETFRGGFR